MTILVGRHFQSEMLPIKRSSKKKLFGTHFCWNFLTLTKNTLFWRAYPTPLRASCMTLPPREAQNLLHSRFSCMLIPFLIFLLDSNQGKVKHSPLYGQGSKVTILVGRHFQSETLPIAIFNQKCCHSKDRPKKT